MFGRALRAGFRAATLSGRGPLRAGTTAVYASSITLSGSTTGTTGSATTWTATLDGPVPVGGGTVSITATGATLSTATLTFTFGGATSQTFTVQRATDGTNAVSITNSMGLATPNSPRSYTSTTSGSLTVGAALTSLAVTSLSGSGARPFSAAVLPLRGEVPSGSTLTTADGSARAAILSTHDDGSAAVVVLAGTASATGSLAVHLATGSDSTALGAAAISALVSSVSVAFGSPYGTASITDFSAPERVWWANSRTICARYRVAAPTPGSTALEAVVDIHAWDGRAFVQVVVENAKVNTALSTVLAAAAAGYTGATVAINGTTVATVSSSGVPVEGAHSWSRAWYASGWVGGNPGLRVHQAVAELQLHPLLFKMDQANTADLSAYATDAYAAWSSGRIEAANMGGVGDAPGIGPLSKWDAQWLQSGDVGAANAVEQNALMALHFNINSRSASTGAVPTFTEIDLKSFNGNGTWPEQTNASTALEWELMHHPAVGLAAFLVRPSPVFIELAQKVAVWNAMYVTNFDRSTVQPTGVFRGGASTSRGRAWGLRSLAHAIFLTPDGDAWKAPAKVNLAANVTYLDGYRTSADAKLGVTWEGDPDLPTSTDYNTGDFGTGFAIRQWMYQYLLVEVHKIASARLLTGADQTAISTLADWMCSYPVRWILEQPNGGWRYMPYSTVIGDNATTINSPTTWLNIRARTHSDSPAALTGTWYFSTGEPVNYSAGYGNGDTSRPRYVDYFWSALVAAVERGVAGSRAAWTKVQAEVTNLTTWRAGFSTEPRWGSTPKAVAESYGVIDAATSALASGSWLDISSSTNVGPVTNTGPEGSDTIPWLSASGVSTNYRPLMSWGGNLTFDPMAAEVIAVGTSNGFAGDVPAGLHAAELRLSLATGVFAKTWAPFAANVGHQYDANSTTDSPLGRLRRAYADAGLYRKSGGSWAYIDHTGSGKMGIGGAYSPSGEYHPRLGRQGSFLVAGAGGILGRLDEHTGVQSQISASNSGVGGPEVVEAYHPAIDKMIFGGGTGGTTLYTVDSAGTVASFTATFPAGVTEIGPRDAINAVLSPDPQGRAFAWLFDKSVTGKVWRLNLSTQAWTDMGAMPAGVSGSYCVATVPPLGIHVLLASGVSVSAGINDSKVWAYRPA